MLKYVLKGHTEFNVPVRDKDDTEDSKDIWCCEFEPVASDVGAFDRQKPGELQMLLDDGDEVSFCNVLAVAGRLGSVKLLNPLQNDCYRYLFGHQKAILAMTFAKAEPRWLFSKWASIVCTTTYPCVAL